jgi:hypothetical protein
MLQFIPQLKSWALLNPPRKGAALNSSFRYVRDLRSGVVVVLDVVAEDEVGAASADLQAPERAAR